MKKAKSVQSNTETQWLTVQDFCTMYALDQEAWLFRPSTDAECQRIVDVSAEDGSVRLLSGNESSTKLVCQPFMFRKINLNLVHVRAGAGEVYEVWATNLRRQSGSRGRKKQAPKRVPTHPIGYFYFSLAALEKCRVPASVISLPSMKPPAALELDPLEMALDFPNTQNLALHVSVDA